MTENRVPLAVGLFIILSVALFPHQNRWAQAGALDVFYTPEPEQGMLTLGIAHTGFGFADGFQGYNYTSVGFVPTSFLEISAAVGLTGYRNNSLNYQWGPFTFSPAIKAGYSFDLGSFTLGGGGMVMGSFPTATYWFGDSTTVANPVPFIEPRIIAGGGNDFLSAFLNVGYGLPLDTAGTVASIPYGLAVQVSPLEYLRIIIETVNRPPVDNIASFDNLVVSPCVSMDIPLLDMFAVDLAAPIGLGQGNPPWMIELGVSIGFDLIQPQAKPKARLFGRIVDSETADPVQATLSFPEKEISPISVDAQTGDYEIELNPGVYRVRAEGTGYKWKEKGVVLQENDEKLLDFSLTPDKSPKGYFAGTVIDSQTGKALAGVVVTFGNNGITEVVSDNLGIFKKTLPPGSYTVSFNKHGYQTNKRYLTFEDGEKKEVTILLEKPSLTSDEPDTMTIEEPTDTTAVSEIPEPADSLTPVTPEPDTSTPAIIPEPVQPDTTELVVVPEPDTVTEVPVVDSSDIFEQADTMLEIPDTPNDTSASVASVPPDTSELSPPNLPVSTPEFSNVQFMRGSAVIEPSSYHAVDEVRKYMEANPQVSINIEGHTDSIGDDKANLTLSQKRANAVMDWLVDAGIEASRLTATGYGETRPIGDNRTRSGQNANRRIEFIISQD